MFKIDDEEFASPKSYTHTKEPVYRMGITTANGKYIADYLGTQNTGLKFTWDFIPSADLTRLLAVINKPSVTITFSSLDGETSILCLKPTISGSKLAVRVNGKIGFNNITLSTRQIEVTE